MRQSSPKPCLTLPILALALLTTSGWADDIQKGDSADKVYEVLGAPNASMRSEGYEVLQFDRGRVELRDGVVSVATLVSEEEAVRLKAERQQAAIERSEREAVAREERRIEGFAERDRALTNADFLASSGARQVEYWDDFHRHYPDVPIQSEYTAALARRDAEHQQAEADQRLADMERRVADAEREAREAKEEARDARDNRRYGYVTYVPPYISYPNPHVYCPPSTGGTACPPRRDNSIVGAAVSPFGSSYTVYGKPPYVSSTYVSPSCAAPVIGSSSGVRISVSH